MAVLGDGTKSTCHPGAWLQAAVVKRGEGCYVNKPSSAGSFWANHRPEFLFDRVCAPPGCEGETSWQAGDSEKSPDASLRRGTSASSRTRRQKCGLENRERLCRKRGTMYKPEVQQESPGMLEVRPRYCRNQKQASKPKNAIALHDHSQWAASHAAVSSSHASSGSPCLPSLISQFQELGSKMLVHTVNQGGARA